MLIHRYAVFATLCLAGFACAMGKAAADIDYYKSTPTYEMDTQECSDEDAGDRQVSCKYIEIGTIDGYLSEKERKNPKWPALEKYWNNTSRYLKFTGLACARHTLESEAEKIAMDRAQNLVSSLTEHFEERNFTGSLKHAGYRKGHYGWKCKSTANTSANSTPVTTDNSAENNQDAAAEEQARIEEEAAEEQARADAAAAEEQALAEAEARRTLATFILHNEDRYRLGIEFTSQTRRNHAWPGGNQQYNLAGTETYALNCRVGEKICFGAWRDHQTIYWGAGRGNEGCASCCITCGGTFETTLTDGGPDSYPSNGSGNAAENFANILGAVGTLLNGVNGVNGSTGGTVQSAPTYTRRPPKRQSDISGTD